MPFSSTHIAQDAPPDQYVLATELFAEACEAFREALPENHKKSFIGYNSHREMIASIEAQCLNKAFHRSCLNRSLKAINRVAARLSPYFEVINIFIQSNPQYSALGWGAIRLVFVLSSNYATFFEKVSQRFHELVSVLPLYEGCVDELLHLSKGAGSGSRPQLLQSLSLIYNDILRFCFDICKLFSRKQAFWPRFRLVQRLCWTPFDTRFSGLMEDLRNHEREFVKQLKASFMIAEIKQIKRIEDHFLEQDETKIRDLEKEARENLHQHIEALKAWINAPMWEESFEDVSDRRMPGTNEWIFLNTSYELWIQQHQATSIEECKKILSIQGKPGYGKTYLCAALIEHLRNAYVGPDVSGNSDTIVPSTLAFYFFDKQRPKAADPTSAYRAILAQLIYACRRDEHIVDIASMMHNEESKGQLFASREEVLCLISIYFHYLDNVILVIDGLDECAEYTDFLHSLQTVTITSGNIAGRSSLATHTRLQPKCKIALFSRPSVRLPLFFRDHSHTIHLDSTHNYEDIKQYIYPKILNLFDLGMLADDRDADAIASQTADNANGMFLWAVLLIKYLQSDGLTIQDRSDALENLIYFRGLDNLYSIILKGLSRNLPERAQINLSRMFNWVAGSLRPLKISELRYAICLTDHAILERNLIPKLRQSLASLTGALLEIGPDQRVRFIHSSVAEHLRQLSSPERETLDIFAIKDDRMQNLLASSCLSYINHGVPPGPLSGSSQITADQMVQNLRFPFLDYSLKYWRLHASRGLRNAHTQQLHPMHTHEDGSCSQLMAQLSTLIESKERVTLWIEASWLFEFPPSLGSLPTHVDNVVSTTQANRDCRAFQDLATNLKSLDQDLKRLAKGWKNVLKVTPNEIWEPSVPVFTASKFWVSTEDAKLVSLSTADHVGKFILILSQVSGDGLEIGQLKLFPPPYLLEDPPDPSSSNLHIAQNYAEGWVISYEIWDIDKRKKLAQLSVDLPKNDIIALLFDAMRSWHWDHEHGLRFEFPSAISNDLRNILVLSSCISIYSPPTGSRTPKSPKWTFKQRYLDPWCGCTGYLQLNGAVLYSYYAWFSPCGTYILVLRPEDPLSPKCVESSFCPVSWDLAVLKQSSEGKHLPVTHRIEIECRKAPGIDPDYRHGEEFAQIFCFHPSLPIISLWTGKATVLWNIGDPSRPSIVVDRRAIIDMSFSACGNYLYGQAPIYREARFGLVVLDIRYKLESLAKAPERPIEHALGIQKASISRALHRTTGLGIDRDMIEQLASNNTPATQRSGAIVFQTKSGKAQTSVLDQFSEYGAVVMYTLLADGTARAETLTRIPENLVDSETVLTPCGSAGKDSNRLVINRRRRQYYFMDMVDERVLPAILERTKASIPTTTEDLGQATNVLGYRGLRRMPKFVRNGE